MSVIGRAYVNVRGVTREFEGDVERGVNGALDRVAANTRTSGKELGDELGEGVKESSISKKIEQAIVSADTDRAGSDLGQAIGDSLLRDGAMTRAVSRAFDAAMPEINESGKRMQATISQRIAAGLAGGLATMATSPISWIGVAVPPAVTQSFTLLSGTAAAATEIVGTLGPVLAAAGITGAAAMGTLLTSVGAVTLAFKLQKDEVRALGQQLMPVADDFREVADAVGDELFPALADAGLRVNEAIGDELREGLVLTAESIGDLTVRFARLTEQPFFQSNIADTLESNARSLELFGDAGLDVASILSDLGSSGGPAVERIADATRRLTGDLADASRIGDTNGTLAQFFDDAVDTTFQWSRIIGDVSVGLHDVFSASADGSMLDSLEDVTQRFRDWADSATGQDSIGEWFDNAVPTMEAAGNVIGALGGLMADLSGDTGSVTRTLNSLADDALPGLTSILGETTDEFADLLAVVLPVVGGLLERLAPAVGSAAGAIGDDLGPALEDIAGPLGDFLESSLGLVDNITPLAGVAADILAPALEIAATALTGINSALDDIPEPVATTIISLAALRIAFGQLTRSAKFGPAVAQWKTDMAAVRAQNTLTATSMTITKTAASGMMGMLGGPLGIALGAAAIGYGIFAGKSAEAKAQVEAMTGALDEQTGSLTAANRELVVKALEDEGILETAEALGVSMGAVVDAALGESDALKVVNDQIDKHVAALDPVTAGNNQAAGAMQTTLDQADKLRGAISGQNEVIEESTASHRRQKEALEDTGDATRRSATAFSRAEVSTGRWLKQVRELDGGARAATSALRTMRTVTLSVNDAAIKGIEAQIGFEAAIDNAREKMKDTASTLDIGTEAGRDNVGVLLDIAKAADGVTGSADKQQKALKRARDEVLELARSKTKDEDAAKKLTDRIFRLTESYGKVPKDVKTKVESPTLESQIDNAKDLRKRLDDLNNRTFTYTVVEGSTAGSPYSPGAAPPVAPSAPPRGSNGSGGGTGGGRPDDPRAGLDGRAGGVTFTGDININADTYEDTLQKVNQNQRRRSIGGVGGSTGRGRQ